MISKEKKVYRFLTYIFITVLLCHILVASFIIFFPYKDYLTNTRFEKAYRLFGLTGPFFSEDRINVVPRVYCEIKENGVDEWGAVEELGRQEFSNFHQNYLRFDQLLLSGLPRYLCRQIVKHHNTPSLDQDIQSIKKYIQLTNPGREIDSIKLLYTLDFSAEARTDTLFLKQIKFNQIHFE